jgi:hypothetical protein
MAFAAGCASGVIPIATALAIVSGSIRSDTGERPVVPVEPTSAIVDAFQTHQIVALPDAHGNQQSHAFRLALIRDRRFAATVNDIVIELGNARYQDLADRFVRGEKVSDGALQRVWRDTTQVTAGNNYEMMRELFATVRTVNASLPRERRLRVLLGDPPIDWDAVHTPQDHRKWIEMREWFPAAVIEREVLSQQRRALVMYGSMHLQRRNLLSNYEMQHWQTQTIVSLLEGATPTKVFTVWPADLEKPPVDFGSWPVPALATVRGTALGAADFTRYYPSPPARFSVRDGKLVPIPREEWRSLPAEDQFDAVLYLGPASDMRSRQAHEIPPELCSEPGFLEMQLKRIAMAGVPPFEADRLKEYCATVKR